MVGVKTLGVIGGSGLYELPGIADVEQLRLTTPFGDPSDEFIRGRVGDVQMVFLPRHSRGHRLSPSEINSRANVFGMKQLGVEWLISVAAVGSLRDHIAPGNVVIADQFIDRTVARPGTFFGTGIVVHVSLADPVCPVLSRHLSEQAGTAGATVHSQGTYICIEGPQFSTRAESHLYRQWGADIIGMTTWQEAKLAREAEMCFATLALSTDYDCWNTAAGDVRVEEVLRILTGSVDLARRTIVAVAAALPTARGCACAHALENAIITSPAAIPDRIKKDLAVLIGKYVGAA